MGMSAMNRGWSGWMPDLSESRWMDRWMDVVIGGKCDTKLDATQNLSKWVSLTDVIANLWRWDCLSAFAFSISGSNW